MHRATRIVLMIFFQGTGRDDQMLEHSEDRAPSMTEELGSFPKLQTPGCTTVLGISSTTADRHWAYARAWLLAAMEGEL